MAYPADYDDCTALEQLTTVPDLVDYDRIQQMFDHSADTICECSTQSAAVVQGDLAELTNSTNQLISGLGDKLTATQKKILLANGIGTLII